LLQEAIEHHKDKSDEDSGENCQRGECDSAFSPYEVWDGAIEYPSKQSQRVIDDVNRREVRLGSEVLLAHRVVAFGEEVLTLTTSHSRSGFNLSIIEVLVMFLYFLLINSLSNFVLPEVPNAHDEHGAHQGECKVGPSSTIFP